MVEITASKEHINNESVSPLGSIPKQPRAASFWKDIHSYMWAAWSTVSVS